MAKGRGEFSALKISLK